LWFRDNKDVEIGGFGISSKEDPLLVVDFILAPQTCGVCSTRFDPDGLSDMHFKMSELGYDPSEWYRIWIHTHPEMPAEPSCTDEWNLADVYGDHNWAVMAIVSKTGDHYARLVHNEGPPSAVRIDFGIETVDCSPPVTAVDVKSLIEEYDENVKVMESWINEPPEYIGEQKGYVGGNGEYMEDRKILDLHYNEVIQWSKDNYYLREEEDTPHVDSEEYLDLFLEWSE